MRVDLHVHIKRRSNCALHQPDQMADKAGRRGIQGIVLLDHHYYPTKEEIEQTQAKFPKVRLFRGIEITFVGEDKKNDDIVVIGDDLSDLNIDRRLPVNPGLSQLANYLKNKKALTILCHPFRRHDDVVIDFDILTPDCVEIASRNTPKKKRKEIYKLAKKYGMRMVSTSDAHKDGHLGNQCIDLLSNVSNEVELINAVKSYEYVLLEKKLAPVSF